jgi:cyclophilin family peptidyl-prolyl cis-trans isomerase
MLGGPQVVESMSASKQTIGWVNGRAGKQGTEIEMKRQKKRRQLSRWFRQLFVNERSIASYSSRAIRLETLEGRRLMAGDALRYLLGSAQRLDTSSGAPAAIVGSANPVTTVSANSVGEGEQTGEGEAGNDLVAFAKAIAATNTKFYGGAWCAFCTQQKNLFEDGGKYLPFVDVTNPDRTPNSIATTNNITTYPTWVFADGSRLEGVQTLATISQKTGIAIGPSSTPYLSPISNVTVRTGSPLHVPVDAYHPGAAPLTITVTSDNPNLVSASVPSGNRSLRISTDFGDMVFELFEDKAPRATSRVIQLAQSGFYNNLIFHRVIDGFMIQGGDPQGNGSGGSNLGNFDDHFHLDLQHNRSGILSFAKSGDDTNNSQFFITAGPTRHLDSNHSVFGQLVDGESVRDAINKTAVGANDRPVNPVRMNQVTVLDDTENGLVLLKRVGNGTGTANITVTARDSQGNTSTRTFTATVAADNANAAPFLNDIPTLQVNSGSTLTHTLTSQDKDGDAPVYSVERQGNIQYDLSVNSQTGVVTLTPPSNFTGQLQFLARVRQASQATTQDTFDAQLVTVQVNSATTLGLSLLSSSDSGLSNSDRVTNATALSFSVTGTTSGGTVEVLAGATVVGTATANGSTTQVNVQNAGAIAEGNVQFTARQRVGNEVTGTSPLLTATLDRTAPVQLTSGVIPATAFVGTVLNVDLNHAEESSNLRYALENAPAGMTIGATDGRLAWTPQLAQLGARSFTLVLTDLAGNAQRQTFNITVGQEPRLNIRLATVSTSGAPISTIQTGQEFKVQVYVQDQRAIANRQGVFSAFMNLTFDPAVIQPIANSPINHLAPYQSGMKGTVANGRINGLGAISSQNSPLGGNEALLAEVSFTALGSGNAGLRTESTTVDDTALYSESVKLQPGEINFGTSNFAVGLNFTLNTDVFNFDEDSGTQTLNVLANDTVGTGVVLNITQVSTPTAGGTVTIAPDGRSLRFTPAANFSGAGTFTYTAANAQGLSQVATVTVQLTEVNDPPNAVDDIVEVIQNSSQNVLSVLTNDTQGNDTGVVETLAVTNVGTGSAGGTIQIGSSGANIRYTPATGFVGTETFNYTLSDGRGGTDTASVTVTVRPAVPPPVVRDDTFSLQEDAAQATFDVLANDSPATNGDTLRIRSVGKSSQGSTISINAEKTRLLYRPAANLAGPEVITYTVEGSNGGIATGRVTFTMTNTNDAPNAVDDAFNVLSTAGVSSVNVLANDTEVDPGDVMTITAVTQPPSGSGSVAITNNGKSISYTPPSNNFTGSVSFSYTVSDIAGLTDTATVNLTVRNYTPRKISGSLQFLNTDVNQSLRGLSVDLTGTDVTGAAVNTRVNVGANGGFSFDNLAPGEYRLKRQPLPFMNDAGEEITINSAANDGNVSRNMQVTGSLSPSHFGVRDFLGSSFLKSLTAVIDTSNATKWQAVRGSWAGLTGISFQVNTSNLVINAVNSSQQNVTASVPLNHALLSRTSSSDHQLLKLYGDSTKFNLAPAAASSSTANGAEGESADSSSVQTSNAVTPGSSIQAQSQVPTASPSQSGNQVSSSASAGTSGQSPSQPTTLSPQQALRQMLGSSHRTNGQTAGTTQASTSTQAGDLDQQSVSELLDDGLLDLLASEERR